MAAPKGLVQLDSDAVDALYGSYQAVFELDGEVHTVTAVVSRSMAAVLCDVLAVKAALDAGLQDLSALPLHSGLALQPLTEHARAVVAVASFAQLATQLQECVEPPAQRWESCRSVEAAARLAASLGHTAALQLLLLLEPAAATAASTGWQTPLHVAAQYGHAGALALLLHSAPPSALLAPDSRGWTPLHCAAGCGGGEATRLLLRAAPEAAAAKDSRGCTPLHAAARHGHTDALQLLLHAAPAMATAADAAGSTPLHLAAQQGHSGAVRLLLAACPAAATAADGHGCTPLQMALSGGKACLDALPEFVAARQLPTDQQWAAVPTPCPQLRRALPAALAQSEALAARLVRRLAPADAERLRTLALCLARQQRRLGVALPPAVLGLLLAQGVAAA